MRQHLLAAAAACSLALTLPAQWAELGDAGELASTTQIPCGIGPLTTITGVLPTPSDTDMYLIRVPDPTLFSATTNNAATTVFDTGLWLFQTNGTGLSFNDDDPGGGTLLSTVTGLFLPGPGVYLLAVNAYTNDAENAANDEIWADFPFGVERAPDGAGAGNPVLSHWNLAGSSTGNYQIDLTGAEFVNCASCTSTGLSCAGLALTCGSLPRVGAVLSFTLSGVPAIGIGTAVLRFGPTVPGTLLGPPFLVGCQNYMGGAPSLSLPITLAPATVYVLPISSSPGFVGLPIAIQGLALDVPTFQAYSSNALDAVIGG